MYQIINADCREKIKTIEESISLTFLDPPFNQNKKYKHHDDNMEEEEYWQMIKDICQSIWNITEDGGSIYFMQREKNVEQVLRVLRETNWTFQNLIIWKKMTSASAPSNYRHPKHYQVIVFSTKGTKAKTFNKLRIDPPLLPNQKYERENGMFITDLWEDIRELTGGYFAGTEPLRNDDGSRAHNQQSPLGLLLRIILSSSNGGDYIFDPFAGTGTTLCVAEQLNRCSIGIEIDPNNVVLIDKRMNTMRTEDNINKYKEVYQCTENLDKLWGNK